MLKAFYFLWRRLSMSRQQFVEYYENIHCALVNGHIPPQMGLRRHFPIWKGCAWVTSFGALGALHSLLRQSAQSFVDSDTSFSVLARETKIIV